MMMIMMMPTIMMVYTTEHGHVRDPCSALLYMLLHPCLYCILP